MSNAQATVWVFIVIIGTMIGAAMTLQACSDCAGGGVVVRDMWGVPRCLKGGGR